MKNFEFYKGLFDRELSRKTDIENSINIPIGIIALIFGTNYYLIKEFQSLDYCYLKILLMVIIISIMISIFFLAQSFNNLFIGFNYKNLPDTNDLRKYQTDLEKYNSEVSKKEKEKFEDYLINNFIVMTDNNLKINRKRLLSLYRGKTFMIISFLFTTILGIIFLTNKF